MSLKTIVIGLAAIVALTLLPLDERDVGEPARAVAAAAPAAPAAKPSAFKPTRFSVVVKGSGPDVILIPGLTASRDIWNGTVAAVPGYRYLLIQVAGFAGEPARGNAQGDVVAPLADEIARYIAEKRLGKPAIVGHSMGGTLATMVAARYPARVGKVMAVDILPEPAGLLGSSAAGVRGLAESLRGIAATPGGRNLVNSLMGAFGPPETPGRRSDPDVVARATHELALTDLTPELPKISAPMTVVYASDPESAPPAAVDRNYRLGYAGKRGVKLVRIDRSGHMVMFDQPEKFRAALRDFLKG